MDSLQISNRGEFVFKEDEVVKKNIISTAVSKFAKYSIKIKGQRMSFLERRYLLPIYNSQTDKVLITGRQVEKTIRKKTRILMANGEYKKAKDIVVGDSIISWNETTQLTVISKVTWVSDIYEKECLRVTTRQGYTAEFGISHPLLAPLSWRETRDWEVGDEVGTIDDKQNLVGQLPYWDRITKIENIGVQDCIDFTVEGTHSYIANGFITHNSSTLAFKAVSLCALIPHFTALYVSPTQGQTKTFSIERVKETLDTSEVLKKWVNREGSTGVFRKQFINRSQILMLYAFLSADRIRGNSADLIELDERQDILSDHIPIIMECSSHSPYKYRIDSGTPKSMDNSFQAEWESSDQREWLVPCDNCGGGDYRFWNQLGERNMGKRYLQCSRCGKHIYPQHPNAQWVQAFSEKVKDGFHISQLMVPWIKWDEILVKQKEYSRSRFFNEVLGQSHDSGKRPLTAPMIRANCDPKLSMDPQSLAEIKRQLTGKPIFAGIDWSGGEHSYDVLSLGAYLDDKFTIFYIYRFMGPEAEPTELMKTIIGLLQAWNVHSIGADYGGGYHANANLVKVFGAKRVWKFEHSTTKKKVSWSPEKGRFLLNRTECMTDLFNAIRHNNFVRFPKWQQFEDPYAKDMLNIFSEYSESFRAVKYDHAKTNPDDSFHSILYCSLASMIIYPRPDILNPDKERK